MAKSGSFLSCTFWTLVLIGSYDSVSGVRVVLCSNRSTRFPADSLLVEFQVCFIGVPVWTFACTSLTLCIDLLGHRMHPGDN